jgi:pentatricopeptide repeat protein
VTYGTLIARAGRWDQPKLAATYFRDMQRRGIEPDTVTMNSLINAFAKVRSIYRLYRNSTHQLYR